MALINLTPRSILLTAFAVAFGATFAAKAEDVAVLLSNDPESASQFSQAGATLRSKGYRVLAAENLSGGEMQSLIDVIVDLPNENGKRIVVLLGTFFHSRNETYFWDDGENSAELSQAAKSGLPFSAIFDFAAKSAGYSAVVLGTKQSSATASSGLTAGVGPLSIPQGVSVISGPLDDAARFIDEGLSKKKGSLVELIEPYNTLTLEGFASDLINFAGTGFSTPKPDPKKETEPVGVKTPSDGDVWNLVQSLGTDAALEFFLQHYPDSKHAKATRDQRAQEETLKQAKAAQEESDLNLDVQQRETVQQALASLGMATNGIDGIFGPTTRNSIALWQEKNGYPATSFLTPGQFISLNAVALRADSQQKVQAPKDVDPENPILKSLKENAGENSGSTDRNLAYMKRFKEGIFAEAALTLDETIRTQIQNRLIELELYDGEATGDFNEQTRSAIRSFQAINNINSTGYINDITLVTLLSHSE